MIELTPGLKGGKKQHFNRVNADLICNFHDVMGFEKTKDVFSLEDNTLVDILKRQDKRPAVRKLDTLKINQLKIEQKLYESIDNAFKHTAKHDHSREICLAIIEIFEKVIIPLARQAVEAPYNEIEESHNNFTLRTDNVYVTSSSRRTKYFVRPF